MIQRRFCSIIFAIAWPAFLGMFLSSCHSPESPNSQASSPSDTASEAVEGTVSETATASPAPAVITNVETGPTDADSSDSSSKGKPDSVVNQGEPSSSSTSPSDAPIATDSKTTEAQAKASEKRNIAEIKIDETVCGAGGQEAYFETKVQEIYICKNGEGLLTYIATPKRKGNSFFLPAQKIQQGDLVGYAAIDETKTYIVTPGGFQLQENGKPTQSEKVIRRQLAKQ